MPTRAQGMQAAQIGSGGATPQQQGSQQNSPQASLNNILSKYQANQGQGQAQSDACPTCGQSPVASDPSSAAPVPAANLTSSVDASSLGGA